MPVAKDITGQRFGRLVVLERVESGTRNVAWKCLCDCGNKTVVYGGNLRNGATKSCGCFQREQLLKRNRTHGLKPGNESTYKTWSHMKDRCNNPNNPNYHHYGGRGITHDPRWSDFKNFFEDMGPKPEDSLTIERIDNNGNYCKENCKWGTRKEQSNNRRCNLLLTFNGETKNAAQWAAKLNMKVTTLHARLNRGWSVEEALSTPLIPHGQTR